MRFASAVLCGVSAGVIGSSALHAAIINPAADTYVQRGSAADNSTNASLAVVNRAGNDDTNTSDRVSFVRFSTSSYTPGSVTAASLQLTFGGNAVPANFDVNLYGIPDGATNENFTASSLTFANSGYTTGKSGSVNVVASGAPSDGTDNTVAEGLLTTIAVYNDANASGVRTDTITISGQALINFLNADTNGIASFIITTDTVTSGGTSTPVFMSSEGISPPALNVTAVPEPATAAVLGLASVGLMGRRRRV